MLLKFQIIWTRIDLSKTPYICVYARVYILMIYRYSDVF